MAFATIGNSALTGSIDLTSKVTGTLPTANGGTGATSYTAGVTEYDVWRLTADVTTGSQTITSNLARTTVLGFQKIGTGMSESSGVFTFPGTGIWEVYARFSANNGANKVRSATCQIQYTANNSSYAQVLSATGNMYDDGTENTYFVGDTKFTFDITDTANQKVKFHLTSDDNNSTFGGSTSTTNANGCVFIFTRLGDT
jgi:hypothetical protein